MVDKTAISEWTRFDPVLDRPSNLEGPAEHCYYARERISKGNWNACPTNNLISNFKMEPAVRRSNPHRWKHKGNAVAQFAQELRRLLPNGFAIAAIPTSKTRDDDEFDPRFDMLFDCLLRFRSDLVVCEPVIRSISVEPAHKQGSRSSIETILESLEYVGFGDGAPPHIVFVDDVITTGKHYSACRRLVSANCTQAIEVYGVFWAKTIWRD